MQHQHFNQIHSTQMYLRENINDFSDTEVLISCDEQTGGIGRTGNKWDFYPDSLAMSFLVTPNFVPTLTTLEIGLLIVQFIKQKFDHKLILKWPNDLMTVDLKKCGGIISNYIDDKTIISGLGINFTSPTKSYNYEAGSICLNTSINIKELSLEIYLYILKNRILDSTKLTTLFTIECAHLNSQVTLVDADNLYCGIFRGISQKGEALIEIDGILKQFLSGTLLLN